ncbi:biotin transporter BioY [Heyndrickxia sp. FSL W8-0496]|mgnify:FL=1|uniref:biotin transporter BioY n=1 Tax=Heyndrickxia TaxID=2837504 RepID=UPI0030FA28E9
MKVRDITYISLFAAVMGALGLIPPITLSFSPVPITIQTIGVLLSGGILGARLGAWSQIVFLAIVATGIPLLSGGRGGIGVFVGPSAGYLFGYIIISFLVGYFISRINSIGFFKILIINVLVGVLLLYVFGIPVQSFIMDIPIIKTIKISLVYIPGDLIKAVVASYLVYKLKNSPGISSRLPNIRRAQ